MKFKLIVITLLCSSLAFSGFFYKIKKELTNVSTIGILTYKVNNSCLDKRYDITKYPDINFASHIIRTSFISNYNALDKDIQFGYFQTDTAHETIIKKYSKALINATDLIYFKNNFDNLKLSRDEIKELCKNFGFDAYAIFIMKASVWRQELKGIILIYNLDHELIWRYKMKAVSTYIIQDPNSPYISEYDKYFDSLEKKADHKSELNKMFDEISKVMATKMKKARYKYFKLNPRKKLFSSLRKLKRRPVKNAKREDNEEKHSSKKRHNSKGNDTPEKR